jgi:hypothetical protein
MRRGWNLVQRLGRMPVIPLTRPNARTRFRVQRGL